MINLEELNLDEIKKEIEEERKKVKDILSGKVEYEKKKLFETILFIVESPNKARTISSFFGIPSYRQFGRIKAYETNIGNKQIIIVATKGHLIDLTTENIGVFGIKVENNKIIPIYNTIKKCLNCGYQFTEYNDGKCPRCGSNNIDDAIERIKILQELAQEVDYVVIGTDPDTEGEMIAYSVYLLLRPFNKNIFRAEFHEVTKKAILNALSELKNINENYVKAQIIRRVEDRWIGFGLSQKAQEYFNLSWLSAGRVQTPVLGWIVKNYEDYSKNKTYYLYLYLDKGFIAIDLETDDKKVVRDLKRELKGKEIIRKDYKEFEEILNPLPPYMTSTLLEDATKYLKIGVDETMRIAQELFEQGLITYHRTDSIRVSQAGIGIAKEYISEKFGEKYFVPREWGEGGAHECIRPTKPIDMETLRNMIDNGEIEVYINMTQRHYLLYDLIFRRFIQSQMKEIRVRKFEEILYIPVINKEIKIDGVLEVIEDGWDKIDEYRIKLLLKKPYERAIINEVKYRKLSKVKLYTQSDIINLMKNKKIGRPSTYASILSKILNKRYVIEKNKFLIPTKTGIDLYKFLSERYMEFVSEDRTRNLEEKMDLVSEGKEDYLKILFNLLDELNEVLKK